MKIDEVISLIAKKLHISLPCSQFNYIYKKIEKNICLQMCNLKFT